jgi:hypothetical protein
MAPARAGRGGRRSRLAFVAERRDHVVDVLMALLAPAGERVSGG